MPALASENLHGGDDHRGVALLVRPGQRQGEVLIAAGVEHLTADGLPVGDDALKTGLVEVRTHPGGGTFKHGLHTWTVAIDDHVAAGLDDPGLGRSDLLQGVAQHGRVVVADVHDHGARRRFDHVGGVKLAAQPDLEHRGVHALQGEDLHGDGGDDLKPAGGFRHVFGDGAHLVRHGAQPLV